MNRRVYAALLILLSTFSLTWFSHIQIHRITEYTCAGLSEIRQAASEKKYDLASQILDETLSYYKHNQHFLEFFIKRETVITTTVILQGLKAYINRTSIADLFSEIAKAQEQLQMMEHLFTAIV